MIVLIPVDVMNVAVMAALAAVIFAEKLWRSGKAFAQAVGVVLIAVGVLAIWIPWLLPGHAHLWHAGDATQATQNARSGVVSDHDKTAEVAPQLEVCALQLTTVDY